MILHVTFQHKDPDYSAAYVVIKTDRIDNVSGYGLAFTLGRGTDIGKFQKYGVASILLWKHCHHSSLELHLMKYLTTLQLFGGSSLMKASCDG